MLRGCNFHLNHRCNHELRQRATTFARGAGFDLTLPGVQASATYRRSVEIAGTANRVGVLFGYFLWFFLVFFMVFRSADARVSQSVKQLVSQLVDSRPSGQSVGEPTERSVSQSVGQPTERPVSQSVGQRAAVSQSVSQSVGRPAAAVSQSASQYVYQPSRQSVGLLIWRYTCKPVSMEYRNRQMRGRV